MAAQTMMSLDQNGNLIQFSIPHFIPAFPGDVRGVPNIRGIPPSNRLCKYNAFKMPENKSISINEIKDTLKYITSPVKNLTKTLSDRESGRTTKRARQMLKSILTDAEIDLISEGYRILHSHFSESQSHRPTRGIYGTEANESEIDLTTIYPKLYEYIPILAEIFIKDSKIKVERFSLGVNKLYAVFRIKMVGREQNTYKYYLIKHSLGYKSNRETRAFDRVPGKLNFVFQSYGYDFIKMTIDIGHCNDHRIKGQNNSYPSKSLSDKRPRD